MKKFVLGALSTALLFEAALTMIWASDGWEEYSQRVDALMNKSKARVWLRQKYRDLEADNQQWDAMLEGIRNNSDLRPISLNEIRNRRGLPPV